MRRSSIALSIGRRTRRSSTGPCTELTRGIGVTTSTDTGITSGIGTGIIATVTEYRFSRSQAFYLPGCAI